MSLRPALSAALLLFVLGPLGVPHTAAAAGGPTCDGHPATMVGGPDHHTLIGTNGPDVIVGSPGSEVIRGRGGRDLICGNGGIDHLFGGPGPDRLAVPGDGRSLLAGGAGDDTLVNRSGTGGTAYAIFEPGPGADTLVSRGAAGALVDLRFTGATRGVRVDLAAGTATGQGHDRLRIEAPQQNIGIHGTPYDDVLRGSGRSHEDFRGGAGDDVIVGRGGNDSLRGGAGADRLRGGGGDDRLRIDSDLRAGRGAQVSDTALGGSGNDTFEAGLGAHDRLEGGAGDDRFFVGTDFSGAPVVSGGGSPGDTLLLRVTASASDQTVRGDLGAGTMQLGPDTISIPGFHQLFVDDLNAGPVRGYDLVGTPEADVLGIPVQSEPATLRGLAGDDTLYGGEGDDTLDGGPGIDTGAADNGNDTCTSVELAPAGSVKSCETDSP